MTEVRIKICGITSPDDAVACLRIGADFLGVIFAESSRRITPERAREIRDAVPDGLLVGVFADAGIDEVSDAVSLCGLDMVQLHGDESPDYCEALHGTVAVPIIKSFRQGEIPDQDGLALYTGVKYTLLDLDKGEPDRNGGAEVLWRQAVRVQQWGRRVFLAGGLDPENVRGAVKQVGPFCVDVCSGVESEPGIKDIEAVERFITEAIA